MKENKVFTVSNKSPILLTGAHRSGTTWAGKILSSAKDLGYIMEPFNDMNRRSGVFNKKFGHFFPYIRPTDPVDYIESFNKTLNYRFSYYDGIINIRSFRDFVRLSRDIIDFSIYKILDYRPFIKDPNALFLAEWLANNFNMQVIILIRHPAAFISSLVKLDWSYPFTDFIKQPELMRDHLINFEDEIHYFSKNKQPLIDQAILLWKILHSVILKYRNCHDDWVCVRHEDLSINPFSEFEKLFIYLNVPFEKNVKDMIAKLSNINSEVDKTSKDIPLSSMESLTRNSHANIKNWKNRLSAKEIDYIYNKVTTVSSSFYSEKDWE